MSYGGKLKEKFIAISLRKKGLSYCQIQNKVKVSKDTISRWCRNIPLTKTQTQKLLNNKKNGLKKGSIIGAKANQKKREAEEKFLLKKGIKQVGKLNKKDRFLIGASLYMGEGSKTGHGVEFTNSNPEAVKFMVRWFKEFCLVDNKDLKCSLWLHDNLDEKSAIIYWSNLIKIPINQFQKTYFAKNKTEKKARKQIHPYGIIKVRFYNSQTLRLIKGWINGILNN